MGGFGPKFACKGSGSGPKLAALGAYVGGLGSGSGPKLAVLGPKWSVLEAIRAKSGPNPSGKAIWQADQAGKWPKPEREAEREGEGTGRCVEGTGRRSGKRIWGGKWPKPERESDLGRDLGPLSFSVPRSVLRIFVYRYCLMVCCLKILF